jgi:hypothetical protein
MGLGEAMTAEIEGGLKFWPISDQSSSIDTRSVDHSQILSFQTDILDFSKGRFDGFSNEIGCGRIV